MLVATPLKPQPSLPIAKVVRLEADALRSRHVYKRLAWLESIRHEYYLDANN